MDDNSAPMKDVESPGTQLPDPPRLSVAPGPPPYSDAEKMKDRKAVNGAGVVTLLLGALMLGASFLLQFIAGERTIGGMYDASDLWVNVVAGIFVMVLGIGVLCRSVVSLSLATLVTLVMLAWSLYIRAELGLGMKMIGTLAIPIASLIVMVKGFGPMRRLKGARNAE